MKHRLLYTSLAMSASMLLGACSQQAYYTNGAELERSTVTMVRLAHPVAAEEDGSAGLSDMSLANLVHFSSTNNVGYGDVVVLDQGADVPADRIEALSSWFTKQGISVGERDGVFGSMPSAGTVTVYDFVFKENLILCGTFLGGIYKSIDGGDTWQHIENEFSSKSIRSLEILSNGNIIAGTGSGIHLRGRSCLCASWYFRIWRDCNSQPCWYLFLGKPLLYC